MSSEGKRKRDGPQPQNAICGHGRKRTHCYDCKAEWCGGSGICGHYSFRTDRAADGTRVPSCFVQRGGVWRPIAKTWDLRMAALIEVVGEALGSVPTQELTLRRLFQ